MPGVELATAWVRIVPSMVGVQGAIATQMAPAAKVADVQGAKVASRFSESFKSKLKVGAAIAGAFAVAAIVKGAKAGVEAASGLAEAGTAVKEIYGDSFGAIEKFSKGAAKNLGQSQLEALNAAKTFGIYGQSAGLAGKANVKFSTGLTTLASDLGSFHDTSPQVAIEAIGAALRGENEPIRQFGILLNDATLRQEALKLGLIKTTKDALTPQTKVLAAQSAIMKQAGPAVGDFARTSGSLANVQRKLGGVTENLSAKFGKLLLPAVTAITSALVTVFTWMGDNQQTVMIIAAAIGALAIAAGIYTVVQWAMNSALLASPITWIVIAIVALVAAIIWVATQTTFFQDVWKGAMDVIGAVINWLWLNVIKPVMDAIGAIWNWLYNNVIAPVVAGIVMYAKMWGAIFNWLWKNVIKPVADFIGKAIKTVGDVVGRVFGAIGDIIRGAFNGVVSFVKGIFNTIIGLVNGVIRGINTVGRMVSDATGGAINIRIGTIPRLARGAIAMPVPGGHLVNVAEAGKPEAIIPLDRLDDMLDGDGKEMVNNYYITTPPGEDPRIVARGLAREFESQRAGH